MSDSVPAREKDLLLRAQTLRQEGKPAEALALLEPLARDEAGSALLHQELAGLYSDLRRTGPAARAARRALEIDPALYRPHGVLARVAMIQGRYAQAEEALRAQLAALPRDLVEERAIVCNQIGAMCFRQKHYDEAGEMLEEALTLDPDSPLLRLNRAMLALQLKEWDRSREELEIVVGLPEVSEDVAYTARLNLGHLCARQGRYDETRAHFAAALELRSAFLPRLYRALPFLARFRPQALLMALLLAALVVYNLVRALTRAGP